MSEEYSNGYARGYEAGQESMLKLAEQPAQQEPVAILNHAHGIHTVRSVKLNGLPDGEYNLYTAPPAQRKPLTDEEIEEVWQRVQASDFHDCVKPFARAIEAKLKEKNT